MHRRFLLILAVAVLMSVCTDGFCSEPNSFYLVAQGEHDIDRGPGGYLAWYKLLLVAVSFLVWVRMTDWINRDAQLIGQEVGLLPEVWNPISLAGFMLAFWAAISVPTFWIGFPVFLLLAFAPFTSYFLIRRAKFIETPSLLNRLSPDPDVAEALPQDDGVMIKFSPAGGSDGDRQRNLIRARRAQYFTEMKSMLDDGAKKRAESIMLDYTRDQVASRMLIDGAWHPMPVMTREVGDSILAALKNLAGLNETDRRSRQQGQFNAATENKKMTLDLMSQGTKTGERVQLKFVEKRKSDLTLAQLGMWPEMIETISKHTGKPGMVIVSSPPRGGLTTSWRAVLGASDRITRDWVSILDEATSYESDVENVGINTFNAAAGENPLVPLKKILLSQPDALVAPDITSAELLDKLVSESINQERTVVTRNQAKSAAEALLRLFALSEHKKDFAKSVSCVVCQRLARRLCDKCKVPVMVKPELIQKLGGDPRKSNTVYNPYKLPPIEQRVDENGKPIEMEDCKVCSGIGFIGRISIYEIINVDDRIREALLKQPKIEVIRKLATANGDVPMMQQGFRLALLGITSVAEVQRVMKE